MNIDHHESFKQMLDEHLAGDISADKERSLLEHLETCVLCQEYRSANTRVIAGLAGFSFNVDPTLNTRVYASLRLRAQTVQPQPLRRRLVLVSLLAVLLTIGGSFVDLQLGNLVASVFDVQRAQLRQGLIAFWIMPSLFVLLLLPLLHMLSRAGRHREERML